MIGDLHVYPAGDLVDHDMTRECWCHPVAEMFCQECEGEGCCLCDEGWKVPGPTDLAVVVHNALDGRE